MPLVVGEVAPSLDQLESNDRPRFAVGRALIRNGDRVGALLQERYAVAIVVKRTLLKEHPEILIGRRLLDEPLCESMRIGLQCKFRLLRIFWLRVEIKPVFSLRPMRRTVGVTSRCMPS